MSNPWRSEAEPGVKDVPKHREPRRGGTMIPWGAAERNPRGLCGNAMLPPWEDKSCVSHSRVPLRFTQCEKPCRLSEALILGGPFTPGSASLRQGLLMVSRLRRWMPKIKNGFWEKAAYPRRKSS